VTEDGAVTGMETVAELLADTHPYLLRSEPHGPDPDAPPSGGTNNSRRQGDRVTSQATLQKKFPALRHR
jgi:hypothetical protein